MKDLLVFYLIKSDKTFKVNEKEFEVNYIKLELTMFAKLLCLALMIKGIH